MQRILIKIGYQEYVMPENVKVDAVFDVFKEIIAVKNERIEGEYIYSPDKEKVDVTIQFIPGENIRNLTPKEVESKEIDSLKSSLSYYKDSVVKEKDKKIEELECKLKLLEQDIESVVQED